MTVALIRGLDKRFDLRNFIPSLGGIIMHRLFLSSACAALLTLNACATAPRAPAASLSQAGLQATGAFATDVRTLSSQLAYVNAADAFSSTYQRCDGRATCAPRELTPNQVQAMDERLKLAAAVDARARALDALGAAYSALAQEAQSNGSADLEGAARRLVTGVNGYVAAVGALPGVGSLGTAVSAPVGEVIAGVAAEIGERRQRERLLAGSRAIAASVQALRNALAAEAGVFDGMDAYIVLHRTAARMAMLNAGLASRSPTFQALAQNLGVTPAPGADGVIANSVAVRAALDATVEASARADVIAMQQRYRTSLEALDALLAGHRELEQTRSVSLASIERVIARLQTVVDAANQHQDANATAAQ